MSEHSWRGNLGRTGGFYQDADWYRANLRRKVHDLRNFRTRIIEFKVCGCHHLEDFLTSHLVQMPLVGKMMEELVAALPPLGNSKVSDRVADNRVIAAHVKVLDLLGGAGQATMAVLEAYPRWVTTCP